MSKSESQTTPLTKSQIEFIDKHYGSAFHRKPSDKFYIKKPKVQIITFQRSER